MKNSRVLKVMLYVLAIGFLATPVWAQTAASKPKKLASATTKPNTTISTATVIGDLESVDNRAPFIADGTVLLTVRMRDMDASWKQFSLDSSAFSSYSSGTFYTKGQIVTIDGESYWAVYERAPVNVSKLSSWQYRAEQMAGSRAQLRPETLLSLSLLRSVVVKQYAKLKDIEPFDEAALSPSFNDSTNQVSYFNVVSLKYLRKISDALRGYKADFGDSVFPPTTSPEAARRALSPYAENPAIFVQPGTNNLYVPNAYVSERKLEDFRVKTKRGSRAVFMVVFYEAEVAKDGTRGVLMLDGSVRRLDEDQWARAKHLSHIDEIALTDK